MQRLTPVEPVTAQANGTETDVRRSGLRPGGAMEARTTYRQRRGHAPLPALLVLLAGALAALVLASSAKAGQEAGSAALTAHGSRFGRILFDSRGFTLYGFTADRKGRSVCTGACAAAWPPYLVKGTLRAGNGVEQSLLGTVRRADGTRQLTYAGRPLYRYVGDRRPGQIRCQGVFEFGGTWLVVRPSGALVR